MFNNFTHTIKYKWDLLTMRSDWVNGSKSFIWLMLTWLNSWKPLIYASEHFHKFSNWPHPLILCKFVYVTYYSSQRWFSNMPPQNKFEHFSSHSAQQIHQSNSSHGHICLLPWLLCIFESIMTGSFSLVIMPPSNQSNPILKVCSISNCSVAVIEWKSAWANPWSKIEGWSSFATRWYDSKFKISRLLAGILATVFLSWYRIRVDVPPGCVFVWKWP